MDSQNLISNNFGFIQQPVTVNQGMVSMPLAAPQSLQQPIFTPMNQNMPVTLMQPVPVQAPTVFNIYQNVPGNADMLVFTPNGLVKGTPAQYCQLQNGNYSPPDGWSLIPREEFFTHLNVLPFPVGVAPLTPSPSPSPEAYRSQSMESSNTLAPRAVNVVQTQQTEGATKVNAKRPHRAKQIKIMKIHTKVKEFCEEKQIFADEKEVLRGPDVCRIHVKTWDGLDLIQDVLEEVYNAVPVARIALPFSMKNKFQKKGFICYLKVQDAVFVPDVQSIFAQYSHAFKKCDVALPTKEVVPTKMEKPMIIPDFDLAPPSLGKRLSAA